MKLFASKLYQRITSSVATFALVVSSVAAIGPFLISSSASALTTVNSQSELVAAIAGSDTEIELGSSFDITSQVNINRTLTLNGNGFRLFAQYTATGGGNDTVLAVTGGNPTVDNLIIEGATGTGLQGIQVWNSSATLQNIFSRNNDKAGIHINNSVVTATNIRTESNGASFGGILISGASTLTVGGQSQHNEPTYGVWQDGSPSVVRLVDTNSQYVRVNIPRLVVWGTVITAGGNIYTLKAAPGTPFITSPASASLVQGDTATATWTAPLLDSYLGVVRNTAASYNVSLDGGTPVNVTSLSHEFTGLTSGTHTVTVQAVAQSGLLGGIATRTFDVNLAPEVTISAPLAGSLVSTRLNGDALTVSGTFTDDNAIDTLDVELWYDGAIVATHSVVAGDVDGAGAFSFDLPVGADVSQGEYTLRYVGRDATDGVTDGAIDFFIDNVAPIVVNLSATPGLVGGVTPTTTIDAQYQSDAVSYVLSIFASDSTLVEQVNSTTGPFVPYVWDVTGLESGTYKVTIEPTDEAGNTGYAELFIEVDNTAPAVDILTPLVFVDNTVTPVVTVTESELIYLWEQVDGAVGGITISDPSVFQPTITVLQDGTYSVRLTVTDALGNATVREISFSYTAPVVEEVDDPALTDDDDDDASETPTITNGFTQVAVLGQATDTTDSDTQGEPEVAAAQDNQTETAAPQSGFAWYWWLLIIVTIIGLGWVIAGYRRNKDQA